jgi:uncharacterized protein YgbK (DUF1537 family)
MTDKLLVIADDLTGANDTAAQFAKRGISVLVITGATDVSLDRQGTYQVIAVNTESRHLAGAQAAKAVTRWVERGRKAGRTHFYKKTDSTLRGNVGVELEAFMKALGRDALPFVPAAPKLKRTTVDGVQRLDGKPLNSTGFAADPLEPLSEGYVPALVRRQTELAVRVVKTAASPAPADGRNLTEPGIYVFDAASTADLRRIGGRLQRCDLLRATAGSAGFAELLAGLLTFEKDAAAVLPPRSDGRWLIVNGSANEVSLRQIARAEAAGFAVKTFAPAELLDSPGKAGAASAARRQALSAEINALAHRGGDVILRSLKEAAEIAVYLDYGRRCGLAAHETHLLVAERLGELTREVLRQAEFGFLIVFGGDTLAAIARAMRWEAWQPLGEILPGVATASIPARPDAPLLITKAGGFGTADVVKRLKKILRSKD